MRALVLAVAVLTSTLASATPPRTVHVDETILGETGEHLMVLRRIRDNLGFHHSMQTDVLLVARPLAGGAASEVWPVRAAVDYGNYWEQAGMKQRLVDRTPENAVEPFALLAERSGFNLLAGPQRDAFVDAAILDAGLEVRQGGKVTHRMTLEEAGIALAESLLVTDDLMSSRAGRPVDFAEVPVSAAHCRTDGHYSFPLSLEPYQPGFAVKLVCADDAETASAGIWLVVPPAVNTGD